jgi:hypothetical protein
MLFLELALIRWLGAEVLYLSFFSNFVLLGAFLGIGLGFIRPVSDRRALRWAPVLLALLVGFVTLFPISVRVPQGSFILVGSYIDGLPPYVCLPTVFAAVAALMFLIGSAVARTFETFESLQAYRLDISGSIIGIALFTGLSFLGAPPVAWGLVVVVLLAALNGRRPAPVQVVAWAALLIILGHQSIQADTWWSPYYRVTTIDRSAGGLSRVDVAVNGVPHQIITPIAQLEASGQGAYLQPWQHATHAPRNVLVIGAGNGKDAAIALAHGAEHVDAVEIDPRIQTIGVEKNPDRPYQDPRVTVHIDDGRAFLERTSSRYDLILLAQTDSLTVVSGQSSLRLESFLFTREAVQTMREHLTEHGVLGAYNFYWQPWYVDRVANTMKDVFGSAPCVDQYGGAGTLVAMTVGRTETDVACGSRWTALDPPVSHSVTDDYPFGYLREPGIPTIYLVVLGLILTTSALAIRRLAGPFRGLRAHADLFLMGTAFLLLETKSIVQFALLFGTTWLVNALVFGGILLVVLLAVEIVRHLRLSTPVPLYALLMVSIAVAWAVPVGALLGLSPLPRLLAAVALAFVPVLLANLIFAQRFRDTPSPRQAFGANLLGAMVGGCLEYMSLLTGYRALLVVVAVLYTGAFIAFRLIAGRSISPA